MNVDLSLLQQIILNLPNYIFWKDTDLIYRGCNNNFAQSAGFNHPSELIGKTDAQMPWGPYTANLYREEDKLILNGEIISDKEVPLVTNQSERILSVSKTALYDENKNIVGVLGIHVDITERKKLEENLIKSKEIAEAADKAKTEFLENMRHDIRTPLSGIVGFADILKEESDSPKVKEYASNLVASSHALLDFLNDILETIRVTSGEIPLLKKKFNLKKIADDILTLNQAKAKSKQINLELNYDHALPLYFIGDPKRIQRILLELVTNALNFTEKGYVQITINAARNEHNDIIVKFSVKDSGIGIPLDKQQEIFERFKRLTPSYTGIYKGAGLGLSIIKQFIDDLEGEIYVDSEIGLGSTFTCLIPIKASLLNDDFGTNTTINKEVNTYLEPTLYKSIPSLPYNKQPNTVNSSQNHLSRILLVEDNNIAEKMATHILTNLECLVDHAPDGKTALLLSTQNDYDVIFMDVGLPDINGYEVTEKIRLQEHDKELQTPIIALTAHVDSENKQHCIESGMNAVLSKPLLKDTAEDILNAFIPERLRKDGLTPCSIKSDEKSSLFSLPNKILDHTLGINATGNEKILQELVEMLFNNISDELKLLNISYSKHNWEAIQDIVHKLNGGASYCGALRLRDACAHLEDYLSTGSTELKDALYKQVVNEIESFQKYYANNKN